jgi:hypothetical protein
MLEHVSCQVSFLILLMQLTLLPLESDKLTKGERCKRFTQVVT